MLGIDEHAQALPTVKSAGPCDRAAQLISLYFELDVSFKRFETPWGNGDRDCARCVVGGQDGAEDADDDGIGGAGGQVVAGEDRALVDEGPLSLVGVGEADFDQAGLGIVIDPSDRFTAQESHGQRLPSKRAVGSLITGCPPSDRPVTEPCGGKRLQEGRQALEYIAVFVLAPIQSETRCGGRARTGRQGDPHTAGRLWQALREVITAA